MNVEINTIRRIMEAAVLDGKRFEISDIERIIGYYRQEWGGPFKTQTGLTPARYVSIFRFRLICNQIRNTGNTIGAIFTDHGMDICNMQRQFKKVFGLTPYQFRHLNSTEAMACLESVFGKVEFEHDFNQ